MSLQETNPLPVVHMAPLASQFVGRQRELMYIWNQYENAKCGSIKVVFLVGELGIGKTRLLDELATRALQDGATVLRGSSSDSEGMPPYLPFLEALGQHIRVTSPEQLREQIAVAPQTLTSILPELATRLGDFPASYPLPPEQVRLRLFEAVGAFLEVISRQYALILILDDLHWADTASLELLCYIARHQAKARLLIVGTYRAGDMNNAPALERAIMKLIHQRVLSTITVAALTSKEIEMLASSYLGGAISSEMSALLYRQSEGNPFIAEEVLRGWIEKGILAQESKRWIVTEPLKNTIPSSIIGALRQRFAHLSTEIVDLLRVASVIGRAFDLPLLATIEGKESEVIEERLLAAERAGLIKADEQGGFAFTHEKIRESLYAEVSTSRRRRLHEAVGRILEIRYNQKSTKETQQLAELAHHFAHSGDRVRGVIYSELAAEQALQSLALKEAMDYYTSALSLLDADDERRGPILLSAGHAALQAGADGRAADSFEEAISWLLRSGKHDGTVQAVYGLGLARWRLGALGEARLAFEHALMLCDRALGAEVVMIMASFASILMLSPDEQSEGADYACQALDLARSLGDKRLEIMATRVLAGNIWISTNDIAQTFQAMEHIFTRAESYDDFSEAAKCTSYLAVLYYATGKITSSHETALRKIGYAEKCGEPYQMRGAYSWLAFLYASQGAWSEAELALEQEQSAIKYMTNPPLQAFLNHVSGFLAYQREDYETAAHACSAALLDIPRVNYFSTLSTALLALTLIAQGKQKEARPSIAKLESTLSKLPEGALLRAPVVVSLALFAMSNGEQVRAKNCYTELLSFRGQFYWFLVDRVLGMLAMFHKEWESAATHFAEGEAIAQREGLRPELAHILYMRAELELARKDSGNIKLAKSSLKRALTLFDELNSVGMVSRIRNLLRTLVQPITNIIPRTFPANLTKSETKVLRLVAQGKSNRQIAQKLGLSEKTIANHLSHIFSKTGSENRAAATAFAIRHGLA